MSKATIKTGRFAYMNATSRRVLIKLNHFLDLSQSSYLEVLESDAPAFDDDQMVVTAHDGDNIIRGFATFRVVDAEERCLVISRLYVHNDYRGLGYAKAMVEELNEKAKKRQCVSMSLQVFAANKKAVNFYANQDFDKLSYTMRKSIK